MGGVKERRGQNSMCGNSDSLPTGEWQVEKRSCLETPGMESSSQVHATETDPSCHGFFLPRETRPRVLS